MGDTPIDDAARTAREATDAATDAAARGFQDAAGQARDAGERMQAAGSAIAGSGSQLGLKMLEQAEANTSEAFRAMRAAAQASDLSEVMRIQSEFLREQGSRSVNQAREISELIAQFGRTTIGQMTGRG